MNIEYYQFCEIIYVQTNQESTDRSQKSQVLFTTEAIFI